MSGVRQEEIVLYDLAEIHLRVDAVSEQSGFSLDDALFSYAIENKNVLQGAIRETVSAQAKGSYQVVEVRILRGSVEIVVVLAAGYEAVSRWKDFVEGIQLIARQLASVVHTFFSRRVPASLTVRTNVLVQPDRIPDPRLPGVRRDPLLVYLIVSNAAMLAVIIGLLLVATFR